MTMPAFTASLFATIPRDDSGEKILLAHALLFEGGRPYWTFPGNGPDTAYVPPDPKYILHHGVIGLLNLVDSAKSAPAWGPVTAIPAQLIPDYTETELNEQIHNITARVRQAGIIFELTTLKGCSLKNARERLWMWENELTPAEQEKAELRSFVAKFGLIPASKYKRPGQR